jgi:hypothetical protein
MGLALIAFRIVLRYVLSPVLLLLAGSRRFPPMRAVTAVTLVASAIFAAFAGRVTAAYVSLPGVMHPWLYAIAGLTGVLMVLAGNNASVDNEEELAAFKAEMIGVLIGVIAFFVAFEWPSLPDLVPGALPVVAFFVFLGAKPNSLPWVRIPVLIMAGLGILRLLVMIVVAIAASGRRATLTGLDQLSNYLDRPSRLRHRN